MFAVKKENIRFRLGHLDIELNANRFTSLPGEELNPDSSAKVDHLIITAQLNKRCLNRD